MKTFSLVLLLSGREQRNKCWIQNIISTITTLGGIF